MKERVMSFARCAKRWDNLTLGAANGECAGVTPQ
jgi:hypothetical protein